MEHKHKNSFVLCHVRYVLLCQIILIHVRLTLGAIGYVMSTVLCYNQLAQFFSVFILALNTWYSYMVKESKIMLIIYIVIHMYLSPF
jgi:hypothetical protein